MEYWQRRPLIKYVKIYKPRTNPTKKVQFQRIKEKPSLNKTITCVKKPLSDGANQRKSPKEFFKLIFIEELLKHMLDQINLYFAKKNVFTYDLDQDVCSYMRPSFLFRICQISLENNVFI